MKKYLFIFKTTLIEKLQFVTDLLIGFIPFVCLIYIFLNLWQYLYSDSSSIIAGFNCNQMIWYVLFTEILYSSKSKEITNDIHGDIKSGNIAYKVNKPYSYIGYILSKNFAHVVIRTIFYAIFGVILGILLLGPLNSFNIKYLPLIIVTFILAIIINSLIKIAISLLSFWVEDSTPFHWIYDKSILVLGTIFPIEVFPITIQPFIKLTPILVTTYGPAKLMVDFSYNNFLGIITAQIIYLIILIIILYFEYKKGVKKLNVNGG